MVSIKDIARAVGMSPATVSRVINGKKYVNQQRREQILKVIAETGYVPDKAARSMVLRRSFTVGIVLSDTFNMFQYQLSSIIERHLDSFGYYTMFFFVKFDDLSEEEFLSRLKSKKLDGIILLQEIRGKNFFDYVAGVKLPVVMATFNRDDKLASIHVDEEQAAYDGVTHLINLGHRKINMITGSGFSFGLQRAKGFVRAMEAAGIEQAMDRVIFVQYYTAEFGIYGMRELLLRGRDFTAVFSATDELALGAMRVLKDEDLLVPEDVSVVGFDDINISSYIIPRLTTIRQPLDKIGEQTALTLHKCICGINSNAVDMLLPHKLIIRESTSPPKKNT
jgi:LacI family transcriptional regulator